MHDLVSDYYSNNILVLESGLKKIKTRIAYLYFVRLLTFLLFLLSFIFFFQFDYSNPFILLSLVGLVSFLFAVKLDFNYRHKAQFLTNKLQVNRNELKFMAHQFQERSTGEEYSHLNPHLAADFDIFGVGSLYQYLNRCSTTIGRTKFAEGLCKSQLNEIVIRAKQKAVEELSGKNLFIQEFQANGMFISESGNELSSLQGWLKEPAEKIKFLQLLCIVIPFFCIGWLTLVAFGLFSLNSIALPIGLSFFVIGLNRTRIQKAHTRLGKTAKTFEKYTTLIRMVENEEFISPYLSDLRQQLVSPNRKASQSLTSLFNLLNSFDIRYNLIVSFILNTLLLFDLQVYCRLALWKAKHRDDVSVWFDALSDVDALISFATFAHNSRGDVSYPTISEKKFAFQATEMGHPLLHSSVRVSNSLLFTGTPSVIIITGANMAGKSTFLRTLSVNLILAMNGSPVCAKAFCFTPCDIMSSIKIQDSLASNESYFYAELVRIKSVMDHAKANPRTLVILDEILRGTNTKDKQQGSLGLLEKLISQNSIVVMATHDLMIGELENKYPSIVINHCFEVELTNDQLIFDYKLKSGISQKLNASFLMRKMEIIN